MKFLETRRVAPDHEGTDWGGLITDDTLIPYLVNPAMIISAQPAANPRHTALTLVEHNGVVIIDMSCSELSAWLRAVNP